MTTTFNEVVLTAFCGASRKMARCMAVAAGRVERVMWPIGGGAAAFAEALAVDKILQPPAHFARTAVASVGPRAQRGDIRYSPHSVPDMASFAAKNKFLVQIAARLHAICIARHNRADFGGPEAPWRLWGSGLLTGLDSAAEGVFKRGSLDARLLTTVSIAFWRPSC